ncbi:MAG: outer membrane protein assembly factor BamA [Saprospiraceae bacterium]|nr:outer membrane protein assembly factor BamA [Saprospiraceae bacterium]
MSIQKIIKLSMVLLSIFLSGQILYAQDVPSDILDYREKKSYEIGGIQITGAETKDRNAIKSIAGLREGNKIQIPGPEIPTAIKALLRLKLFDNVQIYMDSVKENVAFLRIELIERPILSRYSYKGVKTSQHDDLNDIVKAILTKGGIVTDDQKELARKKIIEFYVEKGRLDTEVIVREFPDEGKIASVRIEFDIELNNKIKVEDIVIEGNTKFKDKKLRKKMSKTKKKGTLFRKSKFIEKEYNEDLKSIVKFYQEEGYKDARIIKDTVTRTANRNVLIRLTIDEGNRYYFRNIKWKGNSIYTDEQLYTILGISKGDVYNPELLQNRLKFSLDGRDISSLYLDDGYLAFDVTPAEVAIENDSVDIEMRIFEGPQFTVDNVIIKGNDRTNEHIIRREIRTRPGQKFSRSDIIRSQREIINLGYFNPEALGINTPVNQNRGTVDIEYTLEEKPSDQLELSAGYGGFSGLIGTLGVVFNNFSAANIKDRSTWSPLPQGDGQKLSLRVQSNSRFFKSYNFSFTEPWLGGKRPTSFTIGAVQTAFDYTLQNAGKLKITRAFVGLGSQLKWPDDFFSSNTTLNIEQIDLNKFRGGGFNITVGNFKNFSIRQTITRSSVSDPLFPRRGSRVSLSLQITPPYSLFRETKFFEPSEADIAAIRRELDFENGPGRPTTDAQVLDKINELREAKKFEWLEYHKWRINSEWYYNIFDKFVVAASAKIGILGSFSKDIGISPFERFELGGDGISNQNAGLQGRDILALRGYQPNEIEGNGVGGAPIFNKYTVELRYPLSLNPNSTIYVTTFLQGGNTYQSFKDFNPFDLKRSGGFGARVFLPMFGLLGFDYGFGFDRNLGPNATPGQYGKFNIVLGFEPE